MKKQFIPIFLFILIMIVITVIALPYMELLGKTEYQQEFKNWIDSIGAYGFLLVILMQVIQVIIAFIPGEPIEIIAGVLYGGILGFVICIIGCILASTFIFYLSKKYGIPLINKLFKEKTQKYDFINNTQKLQIIVFILFLIPGTPKDMLTYLVGLSPLTLSRFILISSFARIPSILSSTFLGSTMIQGKWETSLIIFVVTGVIGILGVVYHDRIVKQCKKISTKFK